MELITAFTIEKIKKLRELNYREYSNGWFRKANEITNARVKIIKYNKTIRFEIYANKLTKLSQEIIDKLQIEYNNFVSDFKKIENENYNNLSN